MQRITSKKIIYIVKKRNRNAEKVHFVINEVKNAGGIDYATNKMLSFRDEALQLLYEFEPSETREALKIWCDILLTENIHD